VQKNKYVYIRANFYSEA